MTLKTTPLTDRFGVEIHDFDLSTIDDAGYRGLRSAFEEHSVLLLRDQTLTDDDHIRLARLFGPIEDRNPEDRKPGDAFKVPLVSNIRDDGTVTTGHGPAHPEPKGEHAVARGQHVPARPRLDEHPDRPDRHTDRRCDRACINTRRLGRHAGNVCAHRFAEKGFGIAIPTRVRGFRRNWQNCRCFTNGPTSCGARCGPTRSMDVTRSISPATPSGLTEWIKRQERH